MHKYKFNFAAVKVVLGVVVAICAVNNANWLPLAFAYTTEDQNMQLK